MEPGLEVAEAEGLVPRRHREERAGLERRILVGGRRAFEVDDPLVRVPAEVVEERRVEAGEADEHETRVRMRVPHRLGRVEQLDVALVPLLAADVEDDRRVRRDPVPGAEARGVAGERRVRSHPGRHDPRRLDRVRGVPVALPVGHRRDHVRAAVAREVGDGVTAVELPGVGERGEHDRNAELLGDVDARVEVLAADVVDELAVLGVPLQQIAAHEVDERRRVGGHAEESAARLDLHDLDAAVHEDAMVVVDDRRERRPAVRGLLLLGRPRADDADLMAASDEACGELVREALGSADRGVAPFGEQQPHRGSAERTSDASPAARKRPRSLRRRGT